MIMATLLIVIKNIQQKLKEKPKAFLFVFFHAKADPELFKTYMNSVKQPNYKPTEKFMCDLTNKQK